MSLTISWFWDAARVYLVRDSEGLYNLRDDPVIPDAPLSQPGYVKIYGTALSTYSLTTLALSYSAPPEINPDIPDGIWEELKQHPISWKAKLRY